MGQIRLEDLHPELREMLSALPGLLAAESSRIQILSDEIETLKAKNSVLEEQADAINAEFEQMLRALKSA